ncbi:MAG: class II glutamine amidotransferase [Candidatus Jordarchaeaceae archaeon]
MPRRLGNRILQGIQSNSRQIRRRHKQTTRQRKVPQPHGKTKSKTIIAHVRAATGGQPDTCNSHPFKTRTLERDWIFAHNGDINLNHPARPDIGSNIDSAKLFSYLIDHMEQYIFSAKGIRGIYGGLKNALKELLTEHPQSRINFLLSDGNNMYVFHHYENKPIYILRRQKEYRGATLATTIKRLSTEEWQKLDPDRLLVISNGEFLVISDKLSLK